MNGRSTIGRDLVSLMKWHARKYEECVQEAEIGFIEDFEAEDNSHLMSDHYQAYHLIGEHLCSQLGYHFDESKTPDSISNLITKQAEWKRMDRMALLERFSPR